MFLAYTAINLQIKFFGKKKTCETLLEVAVKLHVCSLNVCVFISSPSKVINFWTISVFKPRKPET